MDVATPTAEALGSEPSVLTDSGSRPSRRDDAGRPGAPTRPTVVLRDGDEPDRERLRARAQTLRVHPLVLRLMQSRGVVEPQQQQRFLTPRLGQLRPPEAMAGFVPALDLLQEARARSWRVGVFGDYDVDGVTTAAILTTYLEALGLEVVARVAHRDRGYGLGVDDARAFADAGVDLVVTGDVGTSDVEALQWLHDQEIKTVVIDHHQVPEVAPPSDAFINPHQDGCGFPFKGLCSAGVAFYLCAGLRTRLAQAGVSAPDPRSWLDLVALATVCDMMPLHHENRVLVAAGLRHLGQRARPGLAALLQIANVPDDEPLDETHVGFKLGPRLNAPGRLGSAEPSLRLLRARSMLEAEPLAQQIEMLNARRRHLTDKTVAEAAALLAAQPELEDRAGIVVAHEGWQPGVVGIAAAQLAQRHGRPVLVLASDPQDGLARGSVRSAGDIDVRAALRECEGLLERYGGHPQAAGVTVRSDRIAELAEAFDAAVGSQASARAQPADVEVVDCALPLRLVDERLCAAVRSIGPYGVGFEPARFFAEDLVVERVRVLKDKHLKLTLGQDEVTRDAMAFSQAQHQLREGDRIGCIFTALIDRFRGQSRLRLDIERLWPLPPR